MAKPYVNPQYRLILYTNLTQQKMRWFSFMRIMLIIGAVWSGLTIVINLSQNGFSYEYAYYDILTTVPGFIVNVVAAYSLYNLKPYTFPILVVHFCQINVIIGYILSWTLPSELRSYLEPSLIGKVFSYLVIGLINFIYFNKRKDIFTADLEEIREKEYPEADTAIQLFMELPQDAVWSTTYLLEDYQNYSDGIRIVSDEEKQLLKNYPQIVEILENYEKLPSVKRKAIVKAIKDYNQTQEQKQNSQKKDDKDYAVLPEFPSLAEEKTVEEKAPEENEEEHKPIYFTVNIENHSEKKVQNIEQEGSKLDSEPDYSLSNIVTEISAIYATLSIGTEMDDVNPDVIDLGLLTLTSGFYFLINNLVSEKRIPEEVAMKISQHLALTSNLYCVTDGTGLIDLSKENYDKQSKIDCLAMNLFIFITKSFSDINISVNDPLTYAYEKKKEVSELKKDTINHIATDYTFYQETYNIIEKNHSNNFIEKIYNFIFSSYFSETLNEECK